jgi:hypothetical protein
MTTSTNTRNEIELLGTEELELVSGGWWAFQYAAAAAPSVKGASSQYDELPAGWGNGMTAAPSDPPR